VILFKSDVICFKVVIVLSPNNTGSVASLDPKYKLEASNTISVPTKLISSKQDKPIDFLELNNILSSFEFIAI
jgi:hypothetical protein